MVGLESNGVTTSHSVTMADAISAVLEEQKLAIALIERMTTKKVVERVSLDGSIELVEFSVIEGGKK